MALTEAEKLELLELEEQEASGAQSQPEQPSRGFMDTVGSVAKNALIAPAKLIGEHIGPEELSKQLPVMGALTGNPAIAGGAAILGRMADLTYGRIQPGDIGSPLRESISPMVQTVAVGVPKYVGGKVQGIAQDLGRRALGFTKGMIKRTPGGTGSLNKVSQEMLDKGVIKFGSGAEATLDRAKDLAKTSGKAVGDALSKTGDKAMTGQLVADDIISQLSPKFSGGAYDADKAIVEEVKNTILAHGDGPISFESAQALKQKLGDLAKFNRLSDASKSNMYRRAYGIVSDALERGLGEASASSLPSYLFNKATYGASQRAIEGLTDKVAGESSNSLLSLRGSAIGAGALASGNVPLALESIGAWEAARRIGTGSGAAALNYLNNSLAISTARRALISQFIDNQSKGEVSR